MSEGKQTASIDAIKKFWDNQATTHGASPLATMPDRLLKELELAAIAEYLEDGLTVADIGCGNGFSSFIYARQFKLKLTGMDYSAPMIEQARLEYSRLKPDLKSAVEFEVGDVKNTGLNAESFDRVITDRCLINLNNRGDQASALQEIHRLLKPGGLYLMCEDTEQGMSNLNTLRSAANLDSISVRWHNLYLDEEHIRKSWSGLFECVAERRFSSLYYLASRVIYAQIAKMESTEPDYNHPINRAAAAVSRTADCGDYGPLKLFVLRKI